MCPSRVPTQIEHLPAQNMLTSSVVLRVLYRGTPTNTIAVGDLLTFRLEARNSCEREIFYKFLLFLLDTGAEISVLPPRPEDRRRGPTKFTLTAANNSPIKTYGERFLNLDLGLRRDFKWRFIIADTNKAILGADFMEHFGIIPDIKGKVNIWEPLHHSPASEDLKSKTNDFVLVIDFNYQFEFFSDIFATNVIAKDPYSGRQVHLIDAKG
ncbi:hypothetical protein LAZ67_X000663 [Cordylochernes scorpioides]|uniref:Peptidase A2 domain-containing protein n=1 Tax=Cordylochernes scorpioides TaxID=51811 RepID=A0ABY6LS12_9ARAC|nr:hypothetical protein LAZ67_X000663 [Cordylochernes scorpioides]